MRHVAAWLSCMILAAALGSSVVASSIVAGAQQPAAAAQVPAAARCRVQGQVTSAGSPLPGASVVVHVGDALKAATSTDIDGRYTILFGPDATYRVSAGLTAFSPAERDLTLGAPPCDTAVDFALTLRPRGEALAPAGSNSAN